MALVRLVWGGHIKNSDTSGGTDLDEWSCSLSLITAQDPDLLTIQSVAKTALQTFHGATGTRIGARAKLEWLKVNEFNPASPFQQITDPTVSDTYSTPTPGAVTGSIFPTFTALKVSLDNGSRDRRTKGGFYLPLYAASPTVNGTYSTQHQTDVLSGFVTLHAALLTGTGVLDVGVWSKANGSVTAVTRVRVGNVPDFISRRKNALVETYVSQTI